MGDNTQHRMQKFVEQEQGRHFCFCGCDEPIAIRRHHYSKGIPWFRPGHNTRVAPPNQKPQYVRLRQDAESVITQYEAGASSVEIAKDYDVPPHAVYGLLKKAGIPRRRVNPPVSYGPDHPQWKGGSRVTTQGYRIIGVPVDSPFASMRLSHGYVYEHRLVMAQHLGRPLRRGETIHHIDGDRLNNSIDNLQLRNGSHNRGIKLQCLDCGSHNVEPVGLD